MNINTATPVLDPCVMLKATPTPGGYIITFNPAVVNRKLAIREINMRLQGYTPRSNTRTEQK